MIKTKIKSYLNKHNQKLANKRKVALKQKNSTIPQQWHHKFSSMKLFTLHHTNFSLGVSVWVLILLLGLGRIFGLISSRIFLHFEHQHLTTYFTQYDMQGTLNVIIYCTTELIPLIITIWLCSNYKWFKNMWIKHGWSKELWTYKHAKFTFIHPFIKWIKIFYRDLKSHWLLVFIATVVVTIIHTVASFLFMLISGPTIASPYTVQLTQLLHENWLLYPIIVILAPIFEETLFRVAIPNILYRMFNIAYKGHATTFKYWLAAIMSALCFASLHEGAASNWGTLASFIVLSLLLQWLYKHSHSLTLPIAVHGLSNLLVVLPDLFI